MLKKPFLFKQKDPALNNGPSVWHPIADYRSSMGLSFLRKRAEVFRPQGLWSVRFAKMEG